MSATRVRNVQLYLDRTFQDWHFQTFDSSFSAIDLDLIGCCPRCDRTIYLIEATTNEQTKCTRFVKQLAIDVGAPALLAFHHEGTVTGGRFIYSPGHPEAAGHELDGPGQLEKALRKIKRKHCCGGRLTSSTSGASWARRSSTRRASMPSWAVRWGARRWPRARLRSCPRTTSTAPGNRPSSRPSSRRFLRAASLKWASSPPASARPRVANSTP